MEARVPEIGRLGRPFIGRRVRRGGFSPFSDRSIAIGRSRSGEGLGEGLEGWTWSVGEKRERPGDVFGDRNV